MKFPSWMICHGHEYDENGMYCCVVGVKKWHPGYWWFIISSIVAMWLYQVAPWLWPELWREERGM